MIKKEGLFGSVTITDAEGDYRYVHTECPGCAAYRTSDSEQRQMLSWAAGLLRPYHRVEADRIFDYLNRRRAAPAKEKE